MPLDTAFSYRVPEGMAPAVGGRVLVPFRQQRLSGIVVDLHDSKPAVVTKTVVSVLDPAPVLDEQFGFARHDVTDVGIVGASPSPA